MKKCLRVIVDWDLCDSHGVCAGSAPEVFDIGEDDQMRLLLPYPPDEQMAAVHAAVRGCPKGALSLVEED